MYKLTRSYDNSGCEGTISKAIGWKKDKTFGGVVSDRPTLGCSMLVGKSETNCWLTTECVEILEEDLLWEYGEKIKFKTKNSTYEWCKYEI